MLIYLVDDNSAMGIAYTKTLEAAGYKVRYFQSGGEAFGSLDQDEIPSLILVDCSMPEESGESFLVRLERERPEIYSNLKIVGLSSFPENSVMVQSFTNKVDFFVEKPDSAKDFIPLLEGIIEKLRIKK